MRVGMEAQNEISSSRVCDFRLTMLTLQQPMLILLRTTHSSTALPWANFCHTHSLDGIVSFL